MRYLTSTKNLVGMLAALAGLLLHVVGVVGAYWPAVVVGLYGVGALLAPSDRVGTLALSSSEEVSQLRRDLAAVLGQAHDHASRLPDTALPVIDRIGEVLTGMLSRPIDLTANPDVLHGVIRLGRQDLPKSIEAYLNIPRWLPGRGAEQLLTQLELLERSRTGSRSPSTPRTSATRTTTRRTCGSGSGIRTEARSAVPG
ncbi:hypothetical protein GCM10029964_075760 [Kibdelosporangium lantanae]